jgi:peptide methionine sulfoxide reductase MsrA
VEVKPETGFWLAEEYHQDYLDKKPNGYCHVNFGVIKPAEKK